MKTRIYLLHAYRYSVAPCEEAFARLWPEAEAVRLLDEGLYADAGADGSLPSNILPRLNSLFRHCVLSGAKGIVFTGSTFGPAVEAAKDGIDVPLLKADEAMSDLAVRSGKRILMLATAKRAMPVIRRNLENAAQAAGVTRSLARSGSSTRSPPTMLVAPPSTINVSPMPSPRILPAGMSSCWVRCRWRRRAR